MFPTTIGTLARDADEGVALAFQRRTLGWLAPYALGSGRAMGNRRWLGAQGEALNNGVDCRDDDKGEHRR